MASGRSNVQIFRGSSALVYAHENAAVYSEGLEWVNVANDATANITGPAKVHAVGRSVVIAKDFGYVFATEDSTVFATGKGDVEATGRAAVRAEGSGKVVVSGQAKVKALNAEGSVIGYGNDVRIWATHAAASKVSYLARNRHCASGERELCQGLRMERLLNFWVIVEPSTQSQLPPVQQGTPEIQQPQLEVLDPEVEVVQGMDVIEQPGTEDNHDWAMPVEVAPWVVPDGYFADMQLLPNQYVDPFNQDQEWSTGNTFGNEFDWSAL